MQINLSSKCDIYNWITWKNQSGDQLCQIDCIKYCFLFCLFPNKLFSPIFFFNNWIVFLVSRGRISGCFVRWSVRGGFVFIRLCVAFVFDVGGVSVTVSLVGDNLGASVGEKDSVRAGDYFAIARFFVSVIVIGSLVLDGVGVTVRLRGLYIDWKKLSTWMK